MSDRVPTAKLPPLVKWNPYETITQYVYEADTVDAYLAAKDARIAELEAVATQIPLLDQLLDKRADEIVRLRAKLRAAVELLREAKGHIHSLYADTIKRIDDFLSAFPEGEKE